MRRLTILALGLAISACNNNNKDNKNSQQQQNAAADSVYYSDIIRPVTDSLEKFPDNPPLYYRRALLLFNTHPELSLKDFEKAAALDTANVEYWAGAGEAALASSNNKKAAELFTRALKGAPEYSYLRYKLATAQVLDKHYQQADSIADILTRSADAKDQAYYLKARIAEDHKDTSATIQHLRMAVSAAGDHPEYEALMELGDLLRAQKNPDGLQYYQLAYRLDSVNAEPIYAYGRFQEDLNKKDAAITAFRKAIISDPGYEAAYMALGDIYRKDGNWKDAYVFYNLAAKAAPTDADAYFNRALCQENLGKKDMALEDYSKASSFRKDFKAAKEAISRLSKK
ncbi:lipopolysaccharide assembly protein LapB [Chitinophaga sp. Cy-1792]|uniref:tetratricopeptide repeat protein n=1 Tax=Chitinophaga sp. Cy-1792 TaxID=2608339 RepID=UPI00142413C6|nr:tetratricopeptide repeat protein [Chitinophaga sp. Cy-1792]NIG54260.1 tetratricopeptide repeat protein [Chitinophaga sp. Cy-1792]